MNNTQLEHVKTFLMKCKIGLNQFHDLDGMLVPREIFLDKMVYDSVKEDISILKQLFTSSALTSFSRMQKRIKNGLY